MSLLYEAAEQAAFVLPSVILWGPIGAAGATVGSGVFLTEYLVGFLGMLMDVAPPAQK